MKLRTIKIRTLPVLVLLFLSPHCFGWPANMHMAQVRITNLPYRTEIQSAGFHLRPERPYNLDTLKNSGVFGGVCGMVVSMAANNNLLGAGAGVVVAAATGWYFGREDQQLYTLLPFNFNGTEMVPTESQQTFVTADEAGTQGEGTSGLYKKMIALSKAKQMRVKSSVHIIQYPFLLIEAKLEGIPYQVYDVTFTGLRPHPPQWLNGVRVTGVRVIEITESDKVSERNFNTMGVSIDEIE